MSEQNTTYLELLEQRIALFNTLSASLLAARSAMVAVDVDGLELRIAQQREICGNIEKLDEQIERIQYQCAAHLRMHGEEASLTDSEQLEETLHRLHQAQAKVRELNTAHQALLKSSRRTVNALLNSLYTFEGTYRNNAVQSGNPLICLAKSEG